jgi:hypothetical protein
MHRRTGAIIAPISTLLYPCHLGSISHFVFTSHIGVLLLRVSMWLTSKTAQVLEANSSRVGRVQLVDVAVKSTDEEFVVRIYAKRRNVETG